MEEVVSYGTNMKTQIINWDKVLLLLDQSSVIKVFMAIVAEADHLLKWYSNIETRARIEWRWQLAPSTVKAAINKLKHHHLIITTSRGVYEVNKKFLM